MDDGFNPYSAWLGVSGGSPPDHYSLLGLDRFEGDARQIAEAADRRVAQLRRTATKDRLELAKQVAKEILSARNCLLSSGEKSVYDASLKNSASRPSPVAAYAAPAGLMLPPRAYDDEEEAPAPDADEAPLEGIALPPEAVPETFDAPPIVEATAPATKAPPLVAVRDVPAPASKRKSPLVPLLVVGIACAAVVAAAIFLPPLLGGDQKAVAQRGPERTGTNPRRTTHVERGPTAGAAQPSQAESVTASSPAETTPMEGSPVDSSAETSPPGMTGSAPDEPEPPSMPTEAMPTSKEPVAMPASTPAWQWTDSEKEANLAATRKTLDAVRAAMSAGTMTTAVEQLDLADLEASHTAAAEEVAHTRAVLEYLRGFWRAADEGFLALSDGQEFEMDGRTVIVVERTPERLVIRATGRNRRYERKKLPPDLALFLAKRWLKPEDVNTPLFLAAFHVFDADGDRAEARRLLETAKAAGTAGAEDLLAELDAASGDKS